MFLERRNPFSITYNCLVLHTCCVQFKVDHKYFGVGNVVSSTDMIISGTALEVLGASVHLTMYKVPLTYF